MDILTREDLRTLVKRSAEVCVSIYMPTHRVGEETQQDPIRLRNLLDEARGQLLAADQGVLGAEELLEPAEQLLYPNPIPTDPNWTQRKR